MCGAGIEIRRGRICFDTHLPSCRPLASSLIAGALALERELPSYTLTDEDIMLLLAGVERGLERTYGADFFRLPPAGPLPPRIKSSIRAAIMLHRLLSGYQLGDPDALRLSGAIYSALDNAARHYRAG